MAGAAAARSELDTGWRVWANDSGLLENPVTVCAGRGEERSERQGVPGEAMNVGPKARGQKRRRVTHLPREALIEGSQDGRNEDGARRAAGRNALEGIVCEGVAASQPDGDAQEPRRERHVGHPRAPRLVDVARDPGDRASGAEAVHLFQPRPVPVLSPRPCRGGGSRGGQSVRRGRRAGGGKQPRDLTRAAAPFPFEV